MNDLQVLYNLTVSMLVFEQVTCLTVPCWVQYSVMHMHCILLYENLQNSRFTLTHYTHALGKQSSGKGGKGFFCCLGLMYSFKLLVCDCYYLKCVIQIIVTMRNMRIWGMEWWMENNDKTMKYRKMLKV